MRPKTILILALLCVSGLGLYHFADFVTFALSPAQPASQEQVIFEVHKGQSVQEITNKLTSLGLISDAHRFLWLGRLTRQWKKMKAGEYQVSSKMAPLEILSIITSGISMKHPLTIREGENIYEIGADLQSKGLMKKELFLHLCKNGRLISSLGLDPPPPSLEGYLYPDTYFLNKSMTPEEILKIMVKHFLSFWTEPLAKRTVELGFTRHQIITLASMIEKETGAPQERSLISSVFHNRLRKKMRLQSDPTTIYGIWEKYDGNLRRNDLLTRNAYNTYWVAALPIGPIANPGKEAILAALYPATSPFLFFVSHNDGTHEFTQSMKEHLHAVQKFQLDPKAREGKSWRDLKRR